MIKTCLVGGWPTPLKNMSSSVGMMKFPTYGKSSNSMVPNHQSDVCMYVCMHACMHVCMYVSMYACMHACMYVCVCMYVCMYVCVWTIWIDVKLLICRGPPGSRGGRWPMKTPPRDPCKRTCKQRPWTANPFGGGRSWALLWQSLGAVVRSWDVTIYIYK